jgi:hypothetical protein
MGPRDITARLLALGASEEEIEHYVFFTNPEGQLDAPEICELLAWASETRCRLLVADAFTGFLVQHDLDGNLGKDVEKAWQRLDRFLAAGIAGRKYDQRHSVERRARNSARWQRARAEARKRDGEQCQQCGSSERLQVHHIVPLSQGGDRYALSNLVTLCQECHARAGGGRAS